jgi:hypothetical protein
MIDEATTARLQAVALAIAPELLQSPLYVLALPDDYPNLENIGGIHTTFDYVLQQHLADRGLWRGAGNIIGINAVDDETALGCLIHETAHAVPFSFPLIDVVQPSAEQVACHRRLIQLANELDDTDRLTAPWVGHGADWIRRVIHLRHRVEMLTGNETPYPAIQVAGWHYRLPNPLDFHRALGNEPARLMDCSFAEIEATPAPHEFSLLFDQGVAAWQRYLLSTKEPQLCQ